MKAFDALYKKYCPQALRTVYLLTRNSHLAEEIVQEAFVKCYREIGKLKDPQAFKAWFYRIVTHLCWRMKPKGKSHGSIEEMSDLGVEAFRSELNLGDALEAKELQKMVMHTIDSLEPPMKTVIILYYFNELSVKEIAGVLKCFEGTVKSRLYYGRKQLEKIICNNDAMRSYLSDFTNRKEFGYHEKASLL